MKLKTIYQYKDKREGKSIHSHESSDLKDTGKERL